MRDNERMSLKPGAMSGTSLALTELICSLWLPRLCLSLLCHSLASLRLHLKHPPKQITKAPVCLENGQGKDFSLKGEFVPSQPPLTGKYCDFFKH